MEEQTTTKKYYWLKLQKDFFKRHDIRVIEAMPNGKDYILFYLKLLVESVSHEGRLRFSDTIPYNEDMLAVVTDTNVDIVRAALKVFVDLRMIEMLEDSTIYMAEVEKMIGSETQWAEKKRLYRATRTQITLDGTSEKDNVLELSEKCPSHVRQEIEKEKEKELELEKELEKDIHSSKKQDKTDYQAVQNLFNETCVSLASVKKLTDARKRAIKNILRNNSMDDVTTVFRKVEESDFLTGHKGSWQATFDWLMNEKNFVKVLEGNYDNRPEIIKGEKGKINWDEV